MIKSVKEHALSKTAGLLFLGFFSIFLINSSDFFMIF